MNGDVNADANGQESEGREAVADILPEPAAGRGWRHIPALDGLRGVAVAAVLLYHGGISWARGGFLGVDAFFVLSGFLITSLLLDETARAGTVALARFWSRRARRLLPALLLVVVAVAGYAALFAEPGTLSGIRKDAIATLAYVANWRFIFAKASYFERTAPPSPLRHTWSLAIEEQFYVVWPLLVWLAARRGRVRLRVGLIAAGLGALSVVAMIALYQPGHDPSRVYYGTDTRANVILIGAVLAALVASRAARQPVGAATGEYRGSGEYSGSGELNGLGEDRGFEGRTGLHEPGGPDDFPARDPGLVPHPWEWVLGGLALAGAAGWFWAVARVDGTAGWLYQGGLPLLALGVAAVIAHAVAVPAGITARVLGLSPLRWLGRVSYGVYLWHWPLFLTLTRARTGLGGWELFAARVSLTLAVSVASLWLVELPIRRGRLPHWRAAVALPTAVAAVTTAIILSTGAVTLAPAAAVLPVTASAQSSSTGVTTPSLPSRRPPRPPGQPVRVLAVGDSVAETLSEGLTPYVKGYGLTLDNEGTLGCGVVRGGPYRYFGQVSQELPDCESWPQRWAEDVKRTDPDVVMVILGRWEVMDRVHFGRWSRLGDLDFDVYLENELEQAIDVLSVNHAKIAFVTAPYYLRGERPDGGRWPEDDPARVDEWNRLLRDVVGRHPDKASIVDLNHKTGPDGVYVNYIDGIKLRYDGVHFTPQGARWLAPWLLPQLAALGPPTVDGAAPYVPPSTTTSSSVYRTPTTVRHYYYTTTTRPYVRPPTTVGSTATSVASTTPTTSGSPTTRPPTTSTTQPRSTTTAGP